MASNNQPQPSDDQDQVSEAEAGHLLGHLHRLAEEGRNRLRDPVLQRLVQEGKSDLRSIRRELLTVPEMMPGDRLLKVFLEKHAHLALAVDEFGGAVGIELLARRALEDEQPLAGGDAADQAHVDAFLASAAAGRRRQLAVGERAHG